MMNNKILVFTKPWKTQTLEELATLVSSMGFDGVELPVRDGYQVTPENVKSGLKKATEVLGKKGLVIGCVAGSLDRATIEAMGDANIPLLRICMPVDMKKGYMASVKETQDTIIALSDVLTKNKVKIGLQNHYGYNIASALGLYHLASGIPSTIAGPVLDFAHCALDGEPIDMAYDILKDSVLMVNFKNAFRARVNSPDEDEAVWAIHWTTGQHGTYSWKDAVALLKKNSYTGYICLPAEYNQLNVRQPLMGDEAVGRTKKDVAFLKKLMKEV